MLTDGGGSAPQRSHASAPADKRASPTFEVGGVAVAALDLPRACDLIGDYARSSQACYATVTGAHGIVEASREEAIRLAHRRAVLSFPDGMPLVWLGRLLGFRSMDRVYGPDLMKAVFARSDLRNLRHFFYGSTPAVINKLVGTLREEFGEFQMVGHYSPPLRSQNFVEDEHVLRHIREARPEIIWVGLSTPKQELWMMTHMPMIGSGLAIGVGAAFDLVSGGLRQAPYWVQRSGLEWLFRLAMEPKRLFRRYSLVVPRFLVFFFEALLKDRSRAASMKTV